LPTKKKKKTNKTKIQQNKTKLQKIDRTNKIKKKRMANTQLSWLIFLLTLFLPLRRHFHFYIQVQGK